MKNLLLIIHKLSNGGAEKAITTIASSLKENYNVSMVVFDYTLKEYIPNVRVIDLKSPPKKLIVSRIYSFLYRVKKIKKIKKDLNIDCSISFLVGGNFVNCSSKVGDKVIISVRNMQSKLNHDIFKRIANRIALKKADKIVTVSDKVKEDILDHYKFDSNKIITIENMIDKKSIEEKAVENIDEVKDKDFLKDGIKIISIGRLIPQKGQWHLIKAFRIVADKYKNAKLIILGRGELKEGLEELIQKLNLQKNVYLLGFKKNPYKYLARSDIFVSTSLYEGMPNVILEAMACDLPVIATDCVGGTKEILGDVKKENILGYREAEYGILLSSLSEKYDITEKVMPEEENIANAIIELISNNEKYQLYVQKSMQRAKDFTNDKVIKKWIDIIE